ncbi:hypothetical protein BDR26DRAFT_936850 [Obelidium mucronatum]|nr:hypothetical protein BDR26DRAFT_936850 [Obelidium mucronatum]
MSSKDDNIIPRRRRNRESSDSEDYPENTNKNNNNHDDHHLASSTSSSTSNSKSISVKRQEQNRRAQQAYRQRREDQIAQLQLKITNLETERRRTNGLIQSLQQKVQLLETENGALRQGLVVVFPQTPDDSVGSSASGHGGTTAATTTAGSSTESLSQAGRSNGERYLPIDTLFGNIPGWSQDSLEADLGVGLPDPATGSWGTIFSRFPIATASLPVPEFDETKSLLRNTLPALASCRAVDLFFELLKKQVAEIEVEVIKTNIVETSILWFQILDGVEIRDRLKVIEIMRTVNEWRATQVERIKYLVENETMDGKSKDTEKRWNDLVVVNVQLFRIAVSHIASLKTPEAVLIVEELCELFLNILCLKEKEDRRNLFVKLTSLHGKLSDTTANFESLQNGVWKIESLKTSEAWIIVDAICDGFLRMLNMEDLMMLSSEYKRWKGSCTNNAKPWTLLIL